MTSQADFRVEIVRRGARLGEIEPAWATLWSRASASIFQHPDWIAAWLRTSPETVRRGLRVALAWRGDELVAVMPLAVRRRRGLRVLEWAAKEHSDYCDALVAPGLDRAPAVRGLWESVVAAGGFDLAYLTHLQPGAGVRSLMQPSGRNGPTLSTSHRRDTSLRLRFPRTGGEAWFNELPGKIRQNYRRRRKILAEVGPPSFRLVGPDEPLGPILDRLADLKRDWLVRTGLRSSILDDEAAPLRAFADVLAKAGILRLFVLECNGVVVAGSLNFIESGRVMAVFLTAFDPAFERASVGTLLMIDYMKWAVDHGLEEVDFLCGAEDYKRRFADHEVELSSAVMGRTLPGRVAVALDALVPTMRMIRRRLDEVRARGRPPVPASGEVDARP